MKNKLIFFIAVASIVGIFAETFILVSANHCAERNGKFVNLRCEEK